MEAPLPHVLAHYVVVVGFLIAAGVVIGYVEKFFRSLFKPEFPRVARRIVRIALRVYALGVPVYTAWLIWGVTAELSAGMIVLVAASELIYLYAFPCAACSVIEGRMILPWTFFSRTFSSDKVNKEAT